MQPRVKPRSEKVDEFELVDKPKISSTVSAKLVDGVDTKIGEAESLKEISLLAGK